MPRIFSIFPIGERGRLLRSVLFTTPDIYFCQLLNRNIEQEGVKAPFSIIHPFFRAASQETRVKHQPSARRDQWWKPELRNAVLVLTEEHHYLAFSPYALEELCIRQTSRFQETTAKLIQIQQRRKNSYKTYAYLMALKVPRISGRWGVGPALSLESGNTRLLSLPSLPFCTLSTFFSSLRTIFLYP